MECITEEKENEIHLIIKDEASISDVSNLFDLLKDSFQRFEGVVVNLTGISAIDFSVLQLFISSYRHANKYYKKFHINANDVVYNKARQLGLYNEILKFSS